MRVPRSPIAFAGGLFFASCLLAQAPPPPAAPPAPRAPAAGDNVQELTRGPIHEAFGQPTVFNPEPGPIVAKKPPELIEEMPPDQKPEGDHVAWIPGYWGWDDEAKNFLWVSGFWRSVPPGRTWVPGYWNVVETGSQWVSGYWMSDKLIETEYLPAPPETLEVGPPTEAADANQAWIPGTWVWNESRFLWRPGFWSSANPDWVWVPARYSWTPSGYVFADGYWDYPLFNRGLLFAPVIFGAVPAGFVYTPSVVIDVRFLAGSLFSRPSWDHYYFGDYYDAGYLRAGIFPWFAFHNSRLGYDPLFAQTNFMYSRRDPQWSNGIRETYFDRREHEANRPPHNYRQYNEWARKMDPDGKNQLAYVRPLAEVAGTRDFPMRMERIDERRAETIRNQSKAIQKFRTDRIRVEQEAAGALPRTGTTADPKAPRGTARTTPSRVKLPEAPRLSPAAPRVEGKGTTTPGVTVPSGTARPPEHPKLPELTPHTPPPATATAPKAPVRVLPHPSENLRPPAVAHPAPHPAPPKKG